MIFEVIDHGIDPIQFFPGVGTAHSPYAMSATGSGSSAKAAGEDALEMFWQGVRKDKVSTTDVERLEKEIDKLSPEEDAHDHCEVYQSGDFVPGGPEPYRVNEVRGCDEECQAAHLVTIRWNEEG